MKIGPLVFDVCESQDTSLGSAEKSLKGTVSEIQQGSSNIGPPVKLTSAIDSGTCERSVLDVDVSLALLIVEELEQSRMYCLSSFIEAWCS